MEFFKKLFLLLVVALGCAAPMHAMDGDPMSAGDLALEKSRALAAQFADLLNDSDDDMLSRDELLEALAEEEEREAQLAREREKVEKDAAKLMEWLAEPTQKQIAAAEAEKLKREAQLAREREKVEKEAAELMEWLAEPTPEQIERERKIAAAKVAAEADRSRLEKMWKKQLKQRQRAKRKALKEMAQPREVVKIFDFNREPFSKHHPWGNEVAQKDLDNLIEKGLFQYQDAQRKLQVASKGALDAGRAKLRARRGGKGGGGAVRAQLLPVKTESTVSPEVVAQKAKIEELERRVERATKEFNKYWGEMRANKPGANVSEWNRLRTISEQEKEELEKAQQELSELLAHQPVETNIQKKEAVQQAADRSLAEKLKREAEEAASLALARQLAGGMSTDSLGGGAASADDEEMAEILAEIERIKGLMQDTLYARHASVEGVFQPAELYPAIQKLDPILLIAAQGYIENPQAYIGGEIGDIVGLGMGHPLQLLNQKLVQPQTGAECGLQVMRALRKALNIKKLGLPAANIQNAAIDQEAMPGGQWADPDELEVEWKKHFTYGVTPFFVDAHLTLVDAESQMQAVELAQMRSGVVGIKATAKILAALKKDGVAPVFINTGSVHSKSKNHWFGLFIQVNSEGRLEYQVFDSLGFENPELLSGVRMIEDQIIRDGQVEVFNPSRLQDPTVLALIEELETAFALDGDGGAAAAAL